MQRTTFPLFATLSLALVGASACGVEHEGAVAHRQAEDPAAAHAAEVFEKFDANKDGAITQAEASGALALHFSGIDLDADGSIDIDEMSEAASKLFEAHQDAEEGGDAEALEAHLEQLMTHHDANQDGELTADELAGGHLAEALDKVDDDKSGGISLEELRAHAERMHASHAE